MTEGEPGAQVQTPPLLLLRPDPPLPPIKEQAHLRLSHWHHNSLLPWTLA